MTTDTRALVDAAQHGDTDAYTQLYRHYAPQVRAYILRRTTCDHQLTEDMLQETFLRAYRKLHQFTWKGRDFGAWLTTIARNQLADHRKRAATQREVTVPDVGQWREDTTPDAEQLVLAEIDAARVRRALTALAPRQRRAVTLQYWGGMSGEQVAAELDCTVGAVKLLGLRGRRQLAAALRSQGVPA